MPKGNTFDNDLLNLFFKGVAIANIADNAVAAPLTNLYVALHTADPTAAGNQSSNETAYTGYARQAVARGAGFTVTGGSVSPAANIDFPQCTALPGAPITHFSIGVAASGATKLLYSGTVTPNIAMAIGVIPRLTTATAVTES